MPDVIITRADSATAARYAARVPGFDGEGELTLSKLSATVVVADHTGVPDSMRGLGVAAALVARLVADARAEGLRIVPQCSYVRALARRNEEAWADVMEL